MLVSDIRMRTGDECCQLQARISWDKIPGHDLLLWYQCPPEYADYVTADYGDPFVAACLAPAMAVGEPLRIECPVSDRLLESTSRIQDIYHCWHRSLRRIPIEAPRRTAGSEEVSPSAEGLFFSLGVDSFYSLLKHKHEVSHLLLVHGFDAKLDSRGGALFLQMQERVNQVAQEVGVRVLPIKTNLRALAHGYTDWGGVYCGAALASVGLMCQGLFKRINIAASHSYRNLIPWGSHALLDPCWSTETLSFVHDGCEAGRVDKIRRIGQSPLALKHARVCFRNPHGTYNCGRCGKCLRTMIGLHIAGVLEKCGTFPRSLPIDAISELSVDNENDRTFVVDLIDGLLRSEPNEKNNRIVLTLRQLLRQPFDESRLGSRQDAMQPSVLRRHAAAEDLAPLISENESIIFVDENKLLGKILPNLRVFSFVERDEQYWGPPADSEAALHELQRLRQRGARYIVFAWPALWWLEYYRGLHEYLRVNFPCVLRNDRLVVFDLRVALRSSSVRVGRSRSDPT